MYWNCGERPTSDACVKPLCAQCNHPWEHEPKTTAVVQVSDQISHNRLSIGTRETDRCGCCVRSDAGGGLTWGVECRKQIGGEPDGAFVRCQRSQGGVVRVARVAQPQPRRAPQATGRAPVGKHAKHSGAQTTLAAAVWET